MELPCNFFVVLEYGETLQGMLDWDKLEFLSVNCMTTDTSHVKRQSNEQPKQIGAV